MKTKVVVVISLLVLVLFGQTVQAAPVQAPISGEIERLTIDNINDHWSGGKIVIGGETVILPRNLLIDLPANRLTLKQIFDQAPAACVAAGESGLAKGDVCNTRGTGGIATIAANVVNSGNTIAGDVFIQKGIESLTGRVTYINYTDGYFRVNGNALNATQVDDNTGVMVRLNDPTSRHTIQQGLGCLAGSQNCSADPRFTLDPDNYVIVFTTGYPVCIPSMSQRTFVDLLGLGTTTAQSLANGTGDVLCPSTNRTISGGQPVDDSRRFAPLMLGDNVTAEGNYETLNCVRFLSVHTMNVAAALTTKNIPGQPDYMFLEEVFIDAPGFQNQRARSLFIGYTTLAPADVLIWSLHRDPATNQAHEFPLATTAGCDTADGAVGTCTGQGIIPGGGDIFRIRHDVDFLIGAKPRLNPCAHLIADPRMWPFGTNTICPASPRTPTGNDDLNTTEMLGILSPIPHEIQARTGKKFADPTLTTLDINGNVATNGQYLFPFGVGLGGIDFPNFFEIDIALIQTPYNFSGIPWNLDRRLSPGGCNGPCEGTPQPLDPFPFEGLTMDPRLQEPTIPKGAYNDTNFTHSSLNQVPYGVSNRILSYVSGTTFGGLYNFDGNNTVLAWPPADPVFVNLPVLPPVAPVVPPVVAITSFPVFSANQGQLYSYQVIATNPSPVCGGLTYSLDLNPAGMTIDAAGLIQWVPGLGQVGPNSVTVRVTDANGFFDVQSFGIVVVPQSAVKIGLYTSSLWYLDANGSGAWEGEPFDILGIFGGMAGASAVAGDWDGTGSSKMGIYADGYWYLDLNGNGVWDGTPTDAMYFYGGMAGAIGVAGDWNATGTSKIGIYADGYWYLDLNGNGVWDGTPTDAMYFYGGMPGAMPVTGDWDGNLTTKIGIYTSDGAWYLDTNGNGVWDGTPTDTLYFYGGMPGAMPVTGDWDATGTTKIGIFDGSSWYLDASGNGVWDGIPADAIFSFGSGLPGAQPVSGRW